jgi:3'(2'), 5'-bisphosphate nucleotidase
MRVQNRSEPNGAETHMTTTPDPAALLPAVLALVEEAGAAIMAVYATGHDVEYKADASPITRADRAAHDILSEGLVRLTPAIPVLSEESEASHAYAVRRQWRQLWLVDPLDGTREFISRNGEFTVNVALIRDHRPVLGVVAAPALGVIYYAAAGRGAFRRSDDGPPEAIEVRPAASPLVVVGSRSHRAIRSTRCSPASARTSCADGSALKFCLVAEGSADFYPRLGPTSEWDTAAAQGVLEVAGGAVIRLDASLSTTTPATRF